MSSSCRTLRGLKLGLSQLGLARYIFFSSSAFFILLFLFLFFSFHLNVVHVALFVIFFCHTHTQWIEGSISEDVETGLIELKVIPLNTLKDEQWSQDVSAVLVEYRLQEYEGELRSRGIHTTADLADLSVDDVERIVPAPKSIHKKKMTELLNAAHTFKATQVRLQDPNSDFHRETKFRAGILNLLTKQASMSDAAGVIAVTKLKGDVNEVFDSLDTNRNNSLEGRELRLLVQLLGYYDESELSDENMAVSVLCMCLFSRFTFLPSP